MTLSALLKKGLMKNQLLSGGLMANEAPRRDQDPITVWVSCLVPALASALAILCLLDQRLHAADEGGIGSLGPDSLPSLFEGEAPERPSAAKAQWETHRRAEILALFERHVYGIAPRDGFEVTVSKQETSTLAAWSARRRVMTVTLNTPLGSLDFRLTVLMPDDSRGPFPVFLGLHLFDSHQAHPRLGQPWLDPTGDRQGLARQEPDWLWQQVLRRGYAVATLDAETLAPDHQDGLRSGVHALFQPNSDSPPGPHAWGTLAAWAWGLSRALDVFQGDSQLDANRVVAIGHSRMGKAALWAGALDERFAMVIANDSGCGGAALSRRRHGETVAHINRTFPHWFCRQFHTYGEAEGLLPVDQHQLLALIAPRPLYVASAQEDDWADPLGEYLSAYHASAIWRAYALGGLEEPELPPLNLTKGDVVGYHLRGGKHDLTTFDWMAFLDFADRFLLPK